MITIDIQHRQMLFRIFKSKAIPDKMNLKKHGIIKKRKIKPLAKTAFYISIILN
jgi:hypothetical protein